MRLLEDLPFLFQDGNMRFGVQNRDVVEDTFRIELFDDVDGELQYVANGYINLERETTVIRAYTSQVYPVIRMITIN